MAVEVDCPDDELSIHIYEQNLQIGHRHYQRKINQILQKLCPEGRLDDSRWVQDQVGW